MTKSEDAEMKGITVIKRFALALLLACPMPGALAQTPTPPAPVEYYRSNIGHTGVAAEKLTPPCRSSGGIRPARRKTILLQQSLRTQRPFLYPPALFMLSIAMMGH